MPQSFVESSPCRGLSVIRTGQENVREEDLDVIDW